MFELKVSFLLMS